MYNPEKEFRCWNCSYNIIAFNNEPVAKCPNCNKYNKVPSSRNKGHTRVFKSCIFTNSFANSNENTLEHSKKIITCPFCDTENIFRRNADQLICYKCRKNILFNNDINIKTNNNIQENNIVGWKIVPSINPITPINPINPITPITPINPITSITPITPITPIQNIPQFQPATPPPKNNDNTEYLLKKILKTIKKNENNNSTTTQLPPQQNFYPMPNFMPFSFIDYIGPRRKYEDDERRNYSCAPPEIRYVPIKTEVNERQNDSGYKIVIRKKKGNNIRSKIFEKVFYFK